MYFKSRFVGIVVPFFPVTMIRRFASYVGFVDEPSDLCLLLVSSSSAPETFFTFQTWKVRTRSLTAL